MGQGRRFFPNSETANHFRRSVSTGAKDAECNATPNGLCDAFVTLPPTVVDLPGYDHLVPTGSWALHPHVAGAASES
jgi:hypothetical protein